MRASPCQSPLSTGATSAALVSSSKTSATPAYHPTRSYHHHPTAFYSARPQSVEGDLQCLVRLRQSIERSTQAQQAVIQEENTARRQLLQQYDALINKTEQSMAQDRNYVVYVAAQKEKVRSQFEATKKLHALFSHRLHLQREAELKQRDEQLQMRREHAETVRKVFHVSRTERYVEKLRKQVDATYESSQQSRMERLHQRYVAAAETQEAIARRAAGVRLERQAHKSQQIVALALERHEKKKLVAQVRSQSQSPTTFLKLPPMQHVFVDDTLVFSPQTLLTRNYQSTYRRPSSSLRAESGPDGDMDGVAPLWRGPVEKTRSCGVGTDS